MAIRVGRPDDAEALQQSCFSGTPIDSVREWLERHRAEIGGFVIRADHRGTGVARKLVEGCATFARELWSAQTLELGVRGGTHAEDAYRGLGFIEWARFPAGFRDRDATYDDVRLLLPVGDAAVAIPPRAER